MTEKQQKVAVAEFAERRSGKGYEKGETQKFRLELLQKADGMADPFGFVEFEDNVMVEYRVAQRSKLRGQPSYQQKPL